MRKSVELVVEALASDPGREMRELKVLPEEELRRRLEEWHGAELGEREKSGRHAGERDKEREKVRAYEAPEGEMEKAIAGVWAEVLQVERVGRQDNFFELGGQSLTAVQVMLRVMQVLGVEVDLRDLFSRPVLSDFVRGMEGAKRGRLPEIERVEREGKIPLSFAQQRLWFLAQME